MLLAQKSVSSELKLLNPIFRVPGVTIATDVILGASLHMHWLMILKDRKSGQSITLF